MDFEFNKEIILENDRVLLKPLVSEDFDHLLLVAIADKTLLQFSPSPIGTPALFKEYIRQALHERSTLFRYAFSVYDKMHQQYAGCTSFANISNYDQRLEIGWTWYGREYQRTGLNRNCKFLMLQFAFEALGFERVEFRIDERNQASRRAVEKIGGQLEGILKSHMLMPDGYRRSTCYYSILKAGWPAVKEGLFKSL